MASSGWDAVYKLLFVCAEPYIVCTVDECGGDGHPGNIRERVVQAECRHEFVLHAVKAESKPVFSCLPQSALTVGMQGVQIGVAVYRMPVMAQLVMCEAAPVIAVYAFVGQYPNVVVSRLADGKHAPAAETVFCSEVFECLGMYAGQEHSQSEQEGSRLFYVV